MSELSKEYWEDYQWANENRTELAKRYANRWVAIVNKEAKGVDKAIRSDCRYWISHLSVVPQKMWEEIEKKPLAEDIMRGIVPKEECFLPVKIAELNGFLMDAKQESQPITFLSYLAPTDKTPLILGVESLLSKCTLYINFLQLKGYIEL